MEDIIDILNQWAGVGLLLLLGLFVLFGFLWGVGRGLKRSWMRLATFAGFIGLALLLTPVISRGLYTSKGVGNLITVFYSDWDDQTAEQFLDVKIDEALTDPDMQSLVERVRTIMPDFEIFVEGIGLAIVNIVVFLLMFFLMKWFSWVVYAILAGNFARKREKKAKGQKIKKRDLAKIPQHRWWGGLVGVASGLVMYFFFIVAVPIAGPMSVLHDIAKYEKFNGEIELDVSSAGADSDTEKLFADIRKIDAALYGTGEPANASAKIYHGITKFTGIQFLARKAFDYQMTVPLETKDADDKKQRIVLSNDLVDAANLTEDVLALAARVDDIEKKLEDENKSDPDYEVSGVEIMEYMSVDKDYPAVKIVIDKLFGLTMFRVVNASMEKVDALLAAGDGTEYFDAVTAGGVTVEKDSFYADLAEEYAVANQKDDFILGVSSVISKVGEKGMNFLRDELKHYVDLTAYILKTPMGEYKNIYRGLKGNADEKEYMRAVQMLAAPAPNASKAGNTVFMELADRAVLNSQFFELIGVANAEKVLSSLTLSDDKKPFISEDGVKYDGKVVVSKANMVKFMGTAADKQWRDVIGVFDGFVVAGAEFDDLPINGGADEIMEYISDAATMAEAKTDKFALAFHNAVTVFGDGDGTPYMFMKNYLTDYTVPTVEFGSGTDAAKINMNEPTASAPSVKNQMLTRLFGTGVDADATAYYRASGKITASAEVDNSDLLAWQYQFRSATIWEMLGNAFADEIKNQINNMGDGKFELEFDNNKAGEIVQNLVPIVTDVVDALSNGGEDGVDTQKLADALIGGDPENPNYDSILAIANAGVTVKLEDETYNSTMNSLADVLGDGVTFDDTDPDHALSGEVNLSQEQMDELNEKFAERDVNGNIITPIDNDWILNKINGMLKPKPAE